MPDKAGLAVIRGACRPAPGVPLTPAIYLLRLCPTDRQQHEEASKKSPFDTQLGLCEGDVVQGERKPGEA